MSGKVDLYLRLKPSLQHSPDSSFFKINNQSELQLLVPPNNREPFCFSDIFYEHYNVIGEKLGKHSADFLISSKNSSIFAFGGKKSGKTYTLLGDPQTIVFKSGILYNIVSTLLDYTKKVTKEKTCSITLNIIEIQNDKVRDLGLAYLKKDELRINSICDQISFHDLEIKEAAGKTYIQDVSILQVSTLYELATMVSLCLKAREIMKSEGNIVVCVNFSQRVKMDVQSARAYLVDYQDGFESVGSQDVQRILNKIYMRSLDMPIKNIQFKANKITYMVQGALTNCSVSIIATIDTENSKFKESQETLIYTKGITNIDKKLKLNYLAHSNLSAKSGEWVSRLQDEVAELELCIKKSHDLYEEKLKALGKIIGIDEDLEALVVGEKGSREFEVCKKFRESISSLNNLTLRYESLEKKNEKYKKIMNDLQVLQTSNTEKNKNYLQSLKSEIIKTKSKISELEETKEQNFTEVLMSSTGNLEKQLYQSHFILEEQSAFLNTFSNQIESNSTDLRNILDMKELGKTELEHEYKRQLLDNDYAYKQNLKSLEDDYLAKSKDIDKRIVEESNRLRGSLRDVEYRIGEFKEEAVKLFDVARYQGKAIYDIEKGIYNQGINPVIIPRNHIPPVPSELKFPLIFQSIPASFMHKSQSPSFASTSSKSLSKSHQFFTRRQNLSQQSIANPKSSSNLSKEIPLDSLLTSPINSSGLSELRQIGSQLQKLIKANADQYTKIHENIQRNSEEIRNKSSDLELINEEKEKFRELYQASLRKRIDSAGSFTERPSSKAFLTEYLSRPQTEKFAETQNKMFRNINTTVSGYRLPFLSRNTPSANVELRPVTTNFGKGFKAIRSFK